MQHKFMLCVLKATLLDSFFNQSECLKRVVANTSLIHVKLMNMGSGCVAQLVERSLPIPEVRGSNPVIGKIY